MRQIDNSQCCNDARIERRIVESKRAFRPFLNIQACSIRSECRPPSAAEEIVKADKGQKHRRQNCARYAFEIGGKARKRERLCVFALVGQLVRDYHLTQAHAALGSEIKWLNTSTNGLSAASGPLFGRRRCSNFFSLLSIRESCLPGGLCFFGGLVLFAEITQRVERKRKRPPVDGDASGRLDPPS